MGRDDDDNDDVGTDGGWVDLARAHPVRDDDPSVGGPQRGRRRCPGRGAHAIGLAVVALGAASSAVTHYSALSSGTWTTSHYSSYYSTDDDAPPRPGFSPVTYRELLAASVQGRVNHTCAIRRGGDNNGTTTETYRNPLECFARFPGIAGCASRMLTGETCADNATRGGGVPDLPGSNHFGY
jgi:hypothetical protein